MHFFSKKDYGDEGSIPYLRSPSSINYIMVYNFRGSASHFIHAVHYNPALKIIESYIIFLFPHNIHSLSKSTNGASSETKVS